MVYKKGAQPVLARVIQDGFHHGCEIETERGRIEGGVHRTRLAQIFSIAVHHIAQRIIVDAQSICKVLAVAVIVVVEQGFTRFYEVADVVKGIVLCEAGFTSLGVVGRSSLFYQAETFWRVVVIVDKLFDLPFVSASPEEE